jgi:probable F420-dependent oxidoreductase
MRFNYAEAGTDPSFYLPLARACEEAGFDGFIVPDSLAYPAESDTVYPFNPDGTREFLEDKPFLDPFSMIAALGAVTESLRFITFVVKLPIRHPVLVAKQAATVAVLTNNRFAFGVGTSPWPEDYELVGVPWENRGRRMDECIDVIRGLTSPGWFEYHGEVFNVPRVKMTPVPDKRIPVLIGGHGKPALRRAATIGDGWMHGGGDPEDLPGLIDRLGVLRKEAGRADVPFEVHVISADAYTLDGLKRLEDQGVTDVMVGFRWPYQVGPDTQPLSDKVDLLRGYAERVIDKLRP